jgi:hypothetical protein
MTSSMTRRPEITMLTGTAGFAHRRNTGRL